MADGPGTETRTHYGNSTSSAAGGNGAQAQARRDNTLKRALWFVGIAAASAGLAYAVVRVTMARPPQDPTTERIQSLIDEANRLLKQLDDKKSG